MARYETCAALSESQAFAIRVEEDWPDLPMGIDGIVFKFNNSRPPEIVGHTACAPRAAIAYKFATQSRVPSLNDVVMQVSGGGLMTPVAVLQPVRITETLMSRLHPHNLDEVKRWGVAIGDLVRMEPGGDVIPKVLQVEKRLDDPARKEVTPPSQYLSCGTDLKHVRAPSTAVSLIGCTNDVSCNSKTLGRLIYLCAGDAMAIRGLGKKTSEKLVESAVVVLVADLFRLTLDDLLNLDSFVLKSASQLSENIQEASSSRSFARLVLGLELPVVGRIEAKSLAQKMESLSYPIKTTESEYAIETFITISNFAERTAEGLCKHPKKQRTLDELRAIEKLGSPIQIVDEGE
ncbi:unnamed protein product [Agarophyton chilense]